MINSQVFSFMRTYALASIVCASLAMGCSRNEPSSEPVHAAKTEVASDSVPILDSLQQGAVVPATADTSVGGFARVLAGLDTLNGMEWYARTIQTAITRHDSQQMSKVRRWSQQELGAQTHADLIFYPFSGPDALYLLGLYPDAKNYVMIASEPAGTFPTLKSLTRDSTRQYLESVLRSTRNVFYFSYFITDSMRKHISDTVVNGVLPLIAMFITQHGYTILGYDKVSDKPIDSTGKGLLRHVLYFRKDTSNVVQQLTYIEANLGNHPYMGMRSLPQNTDLRHYLEQLPQCHTFIKSASYLMHSDVFSTIRGLVLSKSMSILQDDTGIPFRNYGRNWRFRFYGRYEKPINKFAALYQPDLDSAFTAQTPKNAPVPFLYGYLRLRNSQNIFLASRRR